MDDLKKGLPSRIIGVKEVDIKEFKDRGTIIIFAHQDDDLLWMLPFWEYSSKFILAAVPTTPIHMEVIHSQQIVLNSLTNPIQYENNWVAPWGEFPNSAFVNIYWDIGVDPSIAPDTYLSNNPNLRTAVDRIKSKLQTYIAELSVKRIITHNNWGEYGHLHHRLVNQAVRELAVTYKKDVWVLSTIIKSKTPPNNLGNSDYLDLDKPPYQYFDNGNLGLDYVYVYFDDNLFTKIRDVYYSTYISNKRNVWTWISDSNEYPTGKRTFVRIVANGEDLSTNNSQIQDVYYSKFPQVQTFIATKLNGDGKDVFAGI